MEKIIETELYILEGAAIESAEKLDAYAIQKHIKQSQL